MKIFLIHITLNIATYLFCMFVYAFTAWAEPPWNIAEWDGIARLCWLAVQAPMVGWTFIISDFMCRKRGGV